jgi:RimJ/RimL family protein N-acetyltransferase
MQWLIGPSENSNVRAYFGMIFPAITEKEALLEGAFMHPDFGSQKVMPDAMYRVAEKALEMGADSVITFVGANNIPSLRGCKSCGFSPYILRKEKWLLFKHYVSFEAIPPEILADYNAAINLG